jgi:hypothetical protein
VDKITIINFEVTLVVLEDQLLAEVVWNKNAEVKMVILLHIDICWWKQRWGS